MGAGATVLAIVSLKERPQLLETVADRIWEAWWRQEGVPLDVVLARVEESLSPSPLPATLVALSGHAFVGTVSVIASDMDERPQYTPWLAALWVEPEQRGQGAGRALVKAAEDRAKSAGHAALYLAATPDNAGYYAPLGWRILENDVEGLAVMRRALSPSSS